MQIIINVNSETLPIRQNNQLEVTLSQVKNDEARKPDATYAEMIKDVKEMLFTKSEIHLTDVANLLTTHENNQAYANK